MLLASGLPDQGWLLQLCVQQKQRGAVLRHTCSTTCTSGTHGTCLALSCVYVANELGVYVANGCVGCTWVCTYALGAMLDDLFGVRQWSYGCMWWQECYEGACDVHGHDHGLCLLFMDRALHSALQGCHDIQGCCHELRDQSAPK
jgi:hypothetical protein